MKYAIVDIETTGLNYRSDRITEIAILVHNGKEIIHEFISLVNPEKRIPYRIRELTGISDSMVEMAPRFCEIARDIVEITDDCIFVAHNASFDYHFIRQEFKNLGYNYERKTICTKKLSRKLLPDIKKYGLGHLCKELEITVNHRHRAFGDANATVLLFEHLLTLEKEPENISLREIASNIPKEKLQALPEKAGIYYLYNDKQKIIYIGKSTNIRARIFQHMSNNQTKRAIEMRDQSYDVSYELTGSELIALLVESEAIKTHSPKFNRALRRKVLQYGLYKEYNENGYLLLCIKKNVNNRSVPLTSFSSHTQAKAFLFQLVEVHTLCQKLCGLYKSGGACFHHQVHQCHGACIGKEPPDEYNNRVQKAIQPFMFDHESFVVIDKGRTHDEKSLVMVENNRYCGYGYIPEQEAIHHSSALKNYIEYQPDNRDSRQILRSFLRHKRVERIIQLGAETNY